MIVKSRKIANSVVITIPSKFNIPENVEFEAFIDDKGIISFIPVSTLGEEEVHDIHNFMEQFSPVMEKLKDR